MSYKIMPAAVSVLFLAVAAVSFQACSTSNSNSNFDADAQRHVTDWLPASHAIAARADFTSCAECHGRDFAGGISHVSCTTCHMGGFNSIHPSAWNGDALLNHRDYVLNGPTILVRCSNAVCHGSDFKGVPESGPSCASSTAGCHTQTFYNCSSCHGYPPDTGEHVFHMQLTEINVVCQTCHLLTWQTHDNGTVDIASSITYSFTTRSCTPACHETRTWPSP